MEAEGPGGGGVVTSAFGDVQVAGVFEGRETVARMVARLAGPLPVRLAAASSPNVRSRTWWCASMDHCSRARRARPTAVASALVRLVTA
ncbi:MAG: hypothetical protein JO242_09890 [Streptosporangiaceae bacterium]|nr:hypothetical protein [Streptosporangiaceae bacterium]